MLHARQVGSLEHNREVVDVKTLSGRVGQLSDCLEVRQHLMKWGFAQHFTNHGITTLPASANLKNRPLVSTNTGVPYEASLNGRLKVTDTP